MVYIVKRITYHTSHRMALELPASLEDTPLLINSSSSSSTVGPSVLDTYQLNTLIHSCIQTPAISRPHVPIIAKQHPHQHSDSLFQHIIDHENVCILISSFISMQDYAFAYVPQHMRKPRDTPFTIAYLACLLSVFLITLFIPIYTDVKHINL